MMPKHFSRAPWGRRLTALVAVSLLTLAACSDSDDGGVGSSSIETVEIVTLPNNQAVANLVPGTTRQLLGVPTNASGNFIDRPVTWSSSNTAVATVNSDGFVTTLQGGGTTTISAVAGGVTGTLDIAVRFPVGDLNFDTGDFESRREGARTLGLTVLDTQGDTVTDRTITWSSSNEAVATVSSSGVVSATEDAIDGSTATITATAANTADGGVVVTQTVVVTVMGDAVVSSVALSGDSGLWGTPGTAEVTGTALSGLENVIATPITYSSSAAGIATVDAAGVVTFAGDTGVVTISATATGAGEGGTDVVGTVQFRAQPLIENGVPATGVGAASGEDQWFAFYVPAEATEMTVTLEGPNGDGDLYLYRPGSSSITHASFNANTDESITVNRTAASFTGWWLVRMNAWDGAGDVSDAVVTATHNAP